MSFDLKKTSLKFRETSRERRLLEIFVRRIKNGHFRP